MFKIKKALQLSVLIVIATSTTAQAQQSFATWVNAFKIDARKAGISQPLLDQAFIGVTPKARIIELDRKQPEGKLTFAQYKKRVISQARIDQGRRLYRQHRTLLNKISAQYGVQPQFIVALWGIETSYGNNTGGFGVVPALATLAYDGRRSSFFRKELINALKIIDGGHINLANMKGSWAGAMGQNQFMPSSFHAYAVDGNGDGRRDIWTTLPDVFASTANYLSKSGWNGNQRWGRKVKLPAGFPKSLTGKKIKKSILEWKSMGVTLPNGRPLPHVPGIRASIITPDGTAGPAYITYGNYRTIMKWNNSTYFATSVGLLADLIAKQP